MVLEDAIKREEDRAVQAENEACRALTQERKEFCARIAKDHWQYANWLQELKIYRQQGFAIDNFKPEPGATILVSVDTDIWDVPKAAQIHRIVDEAFPDNEVVTVLKGVEISCE